MKQAIARAFGCRREALALLEQLVLRKAQREQKSLVDQKGKSFLDFGFQ